MQKGNNYSIAWIEPLKWSHSPRFAKVIFTGFIADCVEFEYQYSSLYRSTAITFNEIFAVLSGLLLIHTMFGISHACK